MKEKQTRIIHQTNPIRKNEIRIGTIISDSVNPLIVDINNISDILFNLTKYQPIELTHDILLKSGIKNTPGTQRYIFPDLENYYIIFSGKLGLMCCTGNKTIGIPLKYVHQLQNIYLYINGKELHIDLNACIG